VNTRQYHELFRFLTKEYCLLEEDITYVDSVSERLKEMGINEPDREKPIALVSKIVPGCRVLIQEFIPENIINERINALSIRNTLSNVAFDRASLLSTEQKKLAYLFLTEYAKTLPELKDDDRLIDDWAFKEMERMGFFKDKGF